MSWRSAKNIISLQSQSYYGEPSVDHALYFDSLTGKLYHLFSSNGNYNALFSVDLSTGAITLESEYVGETVYDEEMWTELGDLFAGLAFVVEEETVVGDVNGDGQINHNDARLILQFYVGTIESFPEAE